MMHEHYQSNELRYRKGNLVRLHCCRGCQPAWQTYVAGLPRVTVEPLVAR